MVKLMRIGCLFLLTGALLGNCTLQASPRNKKTGHSGGFEAWIVAFEGRVWLHRPDEKKILVTESLSTLEVKDLLQLDSGSEVVLLYRSGLKKIVRVPEWTIERMGEQPGRWRWAYAIRSFFNKSPRVGDGAPRGSKRTGPVLLAPRSGEVLTAQPSVLWLARGGESRIFVTLQTGEYLPDHRDTVWTDNRNGKPLGELEDWTVFKLPYPSKKKDLEVGKSYKLSIQRSTKRISEDAGEFSVISDEERNSVADLKRDIEAKYRPTREDVTADVVYALILYDRELFHEALSLLLEARSRQPDSPAIHQLLNLILGTTYSK